MTLRELLRQLRLLALGETLTLPAAVIVAVIAAIVLRLLAGAEGWFDVAGGPAVVLLVAAALSATLR